MAQLGDRPVHTEKNFDVTLAQPYEAARRQIAKLEEQFPAFGRLKRQQLSLITQAVDNIKQVALERMEEAVKRSTASRTSRDRPKTFTDLPIIERQDVLRSISAEYAAAVEVTARVCSAFDLDSSVVRIAASYAYVSTHSTNRFRYDSTFSTPAFIVLTT